ncbi:hypothetical protein OG402_11875 [Streptomyces anulatus]|uniref:hypothetical protein n=1 Tax=Streptomyces anulatus TaxID=1892 RepID=UPI00225BF1B6|nr:hypothetical protein [Streptomyces anulatus]MCX4601186.1 hypothetical protein [Streptomyces anulatus]
MPDTTPAVWSDGDPLMEAVASAVWEQCRTENSIVVDDPRNIAAVAATVARQLLGTTTTCGSRSLPTYSGNVVTCVLAAGHSGQCHSSTEWPYVSWPNPSHGVWNPDAAVPPAPVDRYRSAWSSARHRAAVLSAELTRRAPLLGEYAAENTRLLAQAVKAGATITRLRAERAELSHQLDCLRGDMRDMEACVREQDAEFERIRRLAGEAAAGVQPPTEADTELTATLVINRNDSYCDGCGKPTLHRNTHHTDISGWTPRPGEGCGARFTATRSDYRGITAADLKDVRPDLPTATPPAAPAAPEEPTR